MTQCRTEKVDFWQNKNKQHNQKQNHQKKQLDGKSHQKKKNKKKQKQNKKQQKQNLHFPQFVFCFFLLFLVGMLFSFWFFLFCFCCFLDLCFLVCFFGLLWFCFKKTMKPYILCAAGVIMLCPNVWTSAMFQCFDWIRRSDDKSWRRVLGFPGVPFLRKSLVDHH